MPNLFLAGLPETSAAHARRGKLKAAAGMQVQPELHLRPNKLVKYDSVAMVMASAQRLGLTKIGLIGNEQFIR